MKRTFRILLTFLCLLAILLAVAVWLAWREQRHDHINRALIAAVKRNDENAVRSLLDHGADVNAPDLPTRKRSLGQTCLDWLSGRRFHYPTALLVALNWRPGPNGSVVTAPTSMVGLLLDRGADVHATDENGFTALMLAAEQQQPDTVSLLLERGADPQVRYHDGSTLLMAASTHENISSLQALLKHGADINAQDEAGNTALMDAAQGRSVEMVHVLLDYHADVNRKNAQGESALSLARRSLWQVPAIIDTLRQAGAKE